MYQSSLIPNLFIYDRAQNRHDDHDLRIVKNFLVNEVDDHFAYGFRGSLLARLAVGALHMNSNDIARDVIDVRKEYHRDSMLPMESAAIIRGLLRIHNVTDALDILDDELAVPDDVSLLAKCTYRSFRFFLVDHFPHIHMRFTHSMSTTIHR